MARANDPNSRPVLRYALLGAIALVLFLSFRVVQPFLVVVAVAVSIAILLHPGHERVARRLGGRRGLAAATMVLLVGLVVLLPLFVYGVLIGEQATRLVEWAKPRLETQQLRELVIVQIPERYPVLNRLRARLGLDEGRIAELLAPAASRVLDFVRGVVQGVVARLATAFLQSILFAFLLFFLLRDGGLLWGKLSGILPLRPAQEAAVALQISRTVKGVLLAMVIVPLAQGVLAVIGFLLFGLPDAFFWGAMLVFAALIPGIGSTLAWVPCAVWLFFARSPGTGIGMALYGTFVISTIDNVIKPVLLREAARIHPMLGFLASIGGILAFGVMGFLLGPVVLSLLLSAIEIYRETFGDRRAVAHEEQVATASSD